MSNDFKHNRELFTAVTAFGFEATRTDVISLPLGKYAYISAKAEGMRYADIVPYLGDATAAARVFAEKAVALYQQRQALGQS